MKRKKTSDTLSSEEIEIWLNKYQFLTIIDIELLKKYYLEEYKQELKYMKQQIKDKTI